jgi:hypothetical protein
MNADGEWNDSRETLLAELILYYYRETGNQADFERVAAEAATGIPIHYGHVYLDAPAAGPSLWTPSVFVALATVGRSSTKQTSQPRTLRSVCDDGSIHPVRLEKTRFCRARPLAYTKVQSYDFPWPTSHGRLVSCAKDVITIVFRAIL